jgi:hypothetical protein
MMIFKEIAETARVVEPSQNLGSINYCNMIAELAEAMDRLEYNLAFQLAFFNARAPVTHEVGDMLIQGWLINLRAPWRS